MWGNQTCTRVHGQKTQDDSIAERKEGRLMLGTAETKRMNEDDSSRHDVFRTIPITYTSTISLPIF